jgi:hypothetical protein
MGMKLAIYEIERLRADLMCLKTQNAEFVRALTMAQDERNAAVKERDEARLEVCEWVEMDGATTAKEEAELRGWDCFKDAPAVKTLKGIVVSKGKAIPPKFDIEENDNV